MSRNGSITTERPFTLHNQIQFRSFFSLCIALHQHLILLSPLVATPMIRECFRSPPLLPQSLSFSIPLLFLSVLRSRISDNDTSWSLSRDTVHSFTFFFSFSPLLRQPFLLFPVRLVQDTRAFSSPPRSRYYSLYPIP